MIQAIVKELDLRQDYLSDKNLSSVYFGGGTPSLLDEAELNALFEAIHRHFHILPGAEITLEANPDDLNPEKLQALRRSPVNRLSIGIQSFSDEDLRFMNRAHNAQEALKCLDLAREAGFDDLSVDLIYAAPSTSNEQWKKNLQIVFDRAIPHLSCYCLTVEAGTALHHFIKKGSAPPVDEEKAVWQLEYLMEASEQAGYEQYEISNFARQQRYARHNTAYWQNKPYLGIGPSAHSYNGHSRQWNKANNAHYRKALLADNAAEQYLQLIEVEQLTDGQRYNEYIMTGLRTMWGVSLETIQQQFPDFEISFLEKMQAYLLSGEAVAQDGRYRLSKKGRFLADHIAMELFG